jgi:hypothetical protein
MSRRIDVQYSQCTYGIYRKTAFLTTYISIFPCYTLFIIALTSIAAVSPTELDEMPANNAELLI